MSARRKGEHRWAQSADEGIGRGLVPPVEGTRHSALPNASFLWGKAAARRRRAAREAAERAGAFGQSSEGGEWKVDVPPGGACYEQAMPGNSTYCHSPACPENDRGSRAALLPRNPPSTFHFLLSTIPHFPLKKFAGGADTESIEGEIHG
jgi:hypothetical protein